MNIQFALEQRTRVEEFYRRYRLGLVTLLFTDRSAPQSSSSNLAIKAQ